mmetsp:Transcript_504/g.1447  ORF Transcript_504/g.1447 Transcript_504/m.1447 type:complete len:553 (+) Transcript_504:127-1785(+)
MRVQWGTTTDRSGTSRLARHPHRPPCRPRHEQRVQTDVRHSSSAAAERPSTTLDHPASSRAVLAGLRRAPSPLRLPLELVLLRLPLGRKLAHRGGADHHVRRLLEAAEDGVLHVRHAVLLADGAQLGRRLLVREHRQLRPEVVLNLVVEPAVHEVVGVRGDAVDGACGPVLADAVRGAEVDRGDDLPHEEGGRLGRHRILEGVEVVSAVVGGDDDEGVEVGHHVGEQEVDDGAAEEERVDEQQWRRQEQEADEHEGAGDLAHVVDEVVAECWRLGGHAGQELADGEGVVLVDRGGDLLAVAAHLVHAELLVRVWRVVEPLPHRRHRGDGDVLELCGEREVAHRDEVALDEVGVAWLPGAEVVEVVVLDVPRLGQHPVEPVHSAPLHGPECEAERGEASGAIVLLVVAAVAGVVRNHRPPGHGPQRQAHHGDEVGLHPHGGDADGAAEVGPEDHALQVLDVRLALPFLEPAAQLAALLAKGGEVDARDPLVLGRHCGRRSRGIRLLQRRSRGDGRMQPAKQRRGVHGRSSGCRDARTHERRRRAQRGRRRRQA